MSDADLGTWRFAYDAAGNVIAETNDRGQLTHSYDALNRETDRDLDGDGHWDRRFVYDYCPNGVGRLCRAETKDGLIVEYSYDERGRMTEERRTVPYLPASYSVLLTQWTYESSDRVSTVTFPNGQKLTYSYDALGMVSAIRPSIPRIEYDAAGHVTVIEYANGVVQGFEYSSGTDRIATIVAKSKAGSLLMAEAYEWDVGGNLLRTKNTLTGKERFFRYDNLGRLTRVQRKQPMLFRRGASIRSRLTAAVTVGGASGVGAVVGRALSASAMTIGIGSGIGAVGGAAALFFRQSWMNEEAYDYDDSGNLTFMKGERQVYDGKQPHAMSYRADLGAFQYDEVGNLVMGGGRTYTWDMENRPLRIVDQNTRTETVFSYDPFGRPAVVSVYSQSKELIQRTLYGSDDFRIRENKGAHSESVVVSVQGVRLASIEATARSAPRLSYFLCDQVGSTRLVTDMAGNVVEALEYSAFGTPTDSAESESTYKYAGQECSIARGLCEFGVRLYDPVIGRFVSADLTIPDPEDGQAFNRYSYALNNPPRYVDPSGYFWMERLHSLAWWVGGAEGAFNVGRIGYSLCDGPCALLGGVVGFAGGSELQFRAAAADAPNWARIANLAFVVGTSSAAGYMAGTEIWGMHVEPGVGAMGFEAGRAALGSTFMHQTIDSVDRSGFGGVVLTGVLGMERVVSFYSMAEDLAAPPIPVLAPPQMTGTFTDIFRGLGYSIAAPIYNTAMATARAYQVMGYLGATVGAFTVMDAKIIMEAKQHGWYR